MPRRDTGQHHAPGAGRPRQPLPVPDAEAHQILRTQTVREAGVRLGISPATAQAWRRRLGIPNPHLLHVSHRHPAAKGLTHAVVLATVQAHPCSRHVVGLLMRQVGCSRQAVYQKLVRLERHGLVKAIYAGSRYRQGWVVVETGNQEKGDKKNGA